MSEMPPAGPGPLPPPPPWAPRPVQPKGALPWGLGLIGLLFLPFLNLVATGVVMTAVGMRQRRYGGLAALNGRRAANWGLTMLVVLAPCIALWIVALSIEARGFFPWGISIIVWALLGVINLIAAIVGLVQANAGRVVRFPAIPFLRDTGR